MELEPPSPLVTVLIATYNNASTLRFTLESVRWQTLQDFEVWVIGDCCTDDSAQVVESFNDPRFNWYNLPKNSGYQSVPHNEGLIRARGKYIAYLNHDDIWLPEHLHLLVGTLEKSDADFAYGLMEGVPWCSYYAIIPFYPNSPFPPEASVTIHRRSVVDEIGFWKLPNETRAIPRVDYFRRAQLKGKQFVLVPSLTVLKFSWVEGDNVIGQLEEYVTHIKSDLKFAEKELAALFVRASAELEGPIQLKRLKYQFANTIRRNLVKLKIDPSRLSIWKRPGLYYKRWRHSRHLD
jgi:glycosyltransferase involved in cell wall biosynthesis